MRTTALDVVGVNARRRIGRQLAQSRLLAAVEIDVFEIECMDVAWDVAEQGEADVDEEICATARDHEDADGREEDGDDNDQDGWCCVGHFAMCFRSVVVLGTGASSIYVQ